MATNMFAQFSNIEGECEDKYHEKWCEITDLEQDFSNPTIPLPPGATEGSGAKPCEHGEIEIKKLVDKASTGLMKACWYGDTVDSVVIECFRTGLGLDDENQPIKYFSIKLEGVIIRDFEYSVGEGNLISETVKLVAAKATYAYRQMLKRTGYGIRAGEASVTVGKANSG